MTFSARTSKLKSIPAVRIVPISKRKSTSNSRSFQGTIDYKNVVLLRKFISSEGKILSRRVSGLTAKQQRYISKAIKNARMMGLLPFINKSQSLRG